MNTVSHCSHGTYVITQDLGDRIQGLRTLGLKTPDANDPIFLEIHNNIKELISYAIPTVTVVTYDMKDLVESVWSASVQHQQKIKDAIVISSCAEVAGPRRGHVIEINRISDASGKTIGLGPRPGHPPLSKQVEGIKDLANGSPVVLAEDGSFTGGTLKCLIQLLKDKKVNVATIVSGICFPGALTELKEIFQGEIVVMKAVEEPFEWMPDHDFIPFAPNCGRVFGAEFAGEFLPHYNHEGISYSFPYIMPFGDPVGWASIPKENARGFSHMCLHQAIKLFEMLDEMNGKGLMVSDLMGSTPRSSAPVSIGNTQVSRTDIPISVFLREACDWIN